MSHSVVTGGQGFIGSHLAKALLDRGDRVTVVDRIGRDDPFGGLALLEIADRVEVVEVDLTDAGAIETQLGGPHGLLADSDTGLFHLAAQTLVGEAVRDPLATFECNVAVTWRLLEVCREAAVPRVVIASSDKAYGRSASLPYREAEPLRPGSPYEASKAACDLIALSYAEAFQQPVAVTRFANVYGGGDLNWSRLIPEAIGAAVSGRDPVIRSDGSPERDYMHVSDAAAAYLAIDRALSEGTAAGRAFNAGTGRPTAVREVLGVLSGILGRDIRPRQIDTPVGSIEIDRQYVDATALEELTGWKAHTTLADGLNEAFEWYSARPQVIGERAGATGSRDAGRRR